MSTDIVWADIERDVVIVQGDDAVTFLNSQLANDTAALSVGQSLHSLLLDPTGHVHSLVRVVRHSDTVFTLDVDAGFGNDVIVRLQRFVLRAKATMSTSDWVVRAFRGTDAASHIGAIPGCAVVAWGSPNAIDVVGSISTLPTLGESTDPGYINMMRADERWPRLGVDLLVGDIPATSGVLSCAVSFTKGCFPGQELVQRMNSRGTSAPVVLRVLERDDRGVGSRVIQDGVDVGTVTSVGQHCVIARMSRSSTIGEPLG